MATLSEYFWADTEENCAKCFAINTLRDLLTNLVSIPLDASKEKLF